jgi:hypothetical protein
VSAPRLLRPAGTIFSAGWFRDYNKLWDARGKLLSSEIISRLEAVNAKAQAEGAKVGPVDLAEMLGPHFRFVVSRPGETAYQVKLDNRLPALALIVSVRDAARFRQRVLTAVDRLLWLGVASNNLGQIKPSEYRGATISTLHFNERPDFTDSEKRVLYNFDPSYSLTRDELIVGSTSEIVRNVIDELDRQAALPQALGATQERLTDHQELSFVELAEYFKEFVPHFVQQAVLNRGLSTADAEKEIAVLRQILLRMAGLTSIASIARNHFEISIRVGPVEEER